MRNLLLATAAVALIAAPASAQSISNAYGSIGASRVSGYDTDLNAVTARIGAKLTPYIGIEGEGSFGIGDDDVDNVVLPTTAELEHDLAAYVTGTIPVSQNLELFGRVGYGTTKIKVEANGFSASDSEESVNWGVGANYFLDGQNGVRADWTRRDFRDGAGEADVWSLSFVRKF